MIPIIDLHCDTLSKIMHHPLTFFCTSLPAGQHLCLDALSSSCVLLQCFALYTDLYGSSSPIQQVSQQLSCFKSLLSRTENKMKQIYTYDDILDNQRSGVLSAMLTLEESCLCKDVISMLPTLFSCGVRIATLTWNYPNRLASPAFSLPIPPSAAFLQTSSDSGLTDLGFEFVETAQKLGIILDVSHLSDAGFRDIASVSTRPFLASHSNTRALCNVPRNLSDSMLRTIANHGGVVGLNLHEPFLSSRPLTPPELLEVFVQHAVHVIQVSGAETPALGTDFDGIPGNRAVPNAYHLSRLEDALKKGGLTSTQTEKLLSRNALRVFKECLP